MSRSTNCEATYAEQARMDELAIEVWEITEQLLANLDHPEVLWCGIGEYRELTRDPPMPRTVQRLCWHVDQWILAKQRAGLGQCKPSAVDAALLEMQLCFKRMGGPPGPAKRESKKPKRKSRKRRGTNA